MAELRAAQAETVRLRPLAIFGDFYPLSPISSSDGGCAAWQHHCDGRAVCGGPEIVGAIHVFRRPDAMATPASCAVSPFAILNAATYSTRFYYDFSLAHETSMNGAALSNLQVSLPLNGSALVEYSCTEGC